MTRLPAVTARELVAVAEKLGFVLDRQKGSMPCSSGQQETNGSGSWCRSIRDAP